MIVCPTNTLVEEHNKKALDLFPGQSKKLFSATIIKPSPLNQQNPVQDVVVPEMT